MPKFNPLKINSAATTNEKVGLSFLKNDFAFMFKNELEIPMPNNPGTVDKPNTNINKAEQNGLPIAMDVAIAMYTKPQGSKPLSVPRMNLEAFDFLRIKFPKNCFNFPTNKTADNFVDRVGQRINSVSVIPETTDNNF